MIPTNRPGVQFLLLTVSLAALSLAMLAAIFGTWREDSLPLAASAVQADAPDMIDRLDMTDSAGAFSRGTLQRVRLDANASRHVAHVVLEDPRERAWPREGEWTSPEVETGLPFIELLPSWNATTPPDTGVRFDVRVRDQATGAWSDWLYMGSWGRILTDLDRKVASGAARVRIDEMHLSAPADAYQVRAQLYSFSLEGAVPDIRRVAVCYSGKASDFVPPVNAVKLERAGADSPGDSAWQRDLPVPFRAQGDSPPPLRGLICSPTSTSMVMQYWGVNRGTVENALAIYDRDYDLFGNWNRAVQRAGELGLDAWLTRFRNWEQVKPLIVVGLPVVATIRFKKGEFPSALYESTRGHLIVIRGFTSSGDVIVNDPARRDKGNGVVYKADELGRAWFGHGGAAYIIRAHDGKPAASQPAGTSDH